MCTVTATYRTGRIIYWTHTCINVLLTLSFPSPFPLRIQEVSSITWVMIAAAVTAWLDLDLMTLAVQRRNPWGQPPVETPASTANVPFVDHGTHGQIQDALTWCKTRDAPGVPST